MNLHPVTHGSRKNRWCGPSVLSAISGKKTDDTADLLRKITGKRNITGTASWSVLRALRQLGYVTRTVPVDTGGLYGWKARPTLASWLQSTRRPQGVVFLVVAGNHWQAVSGRRYVCGRTGEIVSVRDKRVKRRARVSEVYVVERMRPATELKPAPAAVQAMFARAIL